MTPENDDDRPMLALTRLSDVAPERLEWLWEGWLPKGKLCTLDGDPGLGKSTAALDIAATITTGGSWPDSTHCEHQGDVLLLSGEDGLADTVRPRLDAAGADVEHVHAIEGKSYFDPETNQRYLRPLTLADVTDLGNAMAATDARLLIVDVLMAFLPGGTDSHRDQDVRKVLSALGTAADTNGCTVLLLRHLNKAKGGDPLYRGGGSIGIVGAARSGLLVAADPDDPGRRVLASIKSNLGATPSSLTYRLVDAPDHGVARVEWIGASNHTAATVLADSGRDDEYDERDYTADLKASWLYEYLVSAQSAGEKVRPKDAISYGADQGSSRASVFRLFDKLKNAGFARAVDAGSYPKTTFWEAVKGAETTGTTGPSLTDGETTETTGLDLHKRGETTGETLYGSETTENIGSELRKQSDFSAVVSVVSPVLGETGAIASVTALDARRERDNGDKKLSCPQWLTDFTAGLRATGNTTVTSLAVYSAGKSEGYSQSSICNAISARADMSVVGQDGGSKVYSLTGETTGYKPLAQWVNDYLDTLTANSEPIDKDHARQAMEAESAGYSWEAARRQFLGSGRVQSMPDPNGDARKTIWTLTTNTTDEETSA